MMAKYEDYLRRAQVRYGDKFDSSALSRQFVPYFNSGARVKVRTVGMELTGTIGVTTGWRPCFLLMRSSRAQGSSWTLSDKDTILAVKHGTTYKPLATIVVN